MSDDKKDVPQIILEKLIDSGCVLSLIKNGVKITITAKKRIHEDYWTSNLETVKENSFSKGACREGISELICLALIKFNIELSSKSGLIQHLEEYQSDLNYDGDAKELLANLAPAIIQEAIEKEADYGQAKDYKAR